MPTVTFAAGVPSSPRFIESIVDQLITSANITGVTPTTITAQTNTPAGLVVFNLTGVGITAGLIGGVPQLTGGRIDAMTVVQAGALQVTITSINILATDFQIAANKENSGVDVTAMETLLLAQNWTYFGQANADVLLRTSTSSDGVLLNLRGDDRFDLGGGNDNVFTGDGNDTGHGGTGNDKLFGGNDLDQLFGDAGRDSLDGGAGDDVLYGGANAGAGTELLRGGSGKDKLFGQAGVDSLDGGSGNDTLNGGTGDDDLTGGTGRDVFVFLQGDGNDRVTLFDLATDRIDLAAGVTHFFSQGGPDAILHYGNAGDQVLLTGVAFADAGLVVLI